MQNFEVGFINALIKLFNSSDIPKIKQLSNDLTLLNNEIVSSSFEDIAKRVYDVIISICEENKTLFERYELMVLELFETDGQLRTNTYMRDYVSSKEKFNNKIRDILTPALTDESQLYHYKIDAIKFVRETMGFSLINAKTYVEKIYDKMIFKRDNPLLFENKCNELPIGESKPCELSQL
jgi:hypothetical protein